MCRYKGRSQCGNWGGTIYLVIKLAGNWLCNPIAQVLRRGLPPKITSYCTLHLLRPDRLVQSALCRRTANARILRASFREKLELFHQTAFKMDQLGHPLLLIHRYQIQRSVCRCHVLTDGEHALWRAASFTKTICMKNLHTAEDLTLNGLISSSEFILRR